MSFSELDRESTRSGKGLRAIAGRDGCVGILCRNHRDFIEITIAAAKASLTTVCLNTGSAGPEVIDVLDREDVDVLVVDESLLALVGDGFAGPVVVADREPNGSNEPKAGWPAGSIDLAGLRDAGGWLPLPASMPIPPVLLTSGTTGTPKGARRSDRIDPSSATGVVQEIPYRSDDVVAITSPLFHAWGFVQLGIATALGATVVVSPTFSTAVILGQIEAEEVSVLAVVPAILQRLLTSPALDDTDLSTLRIVASSGSALPVPIVKSWLGRVGPNLYNLYGSTEVGQATLADPSELAAHPDTAGHVLPGTVVRILGPDDNELAAGETGRIFVGSGAQFDGYTGGGGKEVVDGLMSTGDVGCFDGSGLLFVTGRGDDMIVSGGENVFPREVEDLLLDHQDVIDAAVTGVADDEFGQRLVAHIVRADGSRLTKAQVRKLVSDRLARHKVPRDVEFVDSLPRTTTGKLRRNLL